MKNLQYLAAESYKVKNGLSTEIMKEVFVLKKNGNCDYTSGTHLANRNIHIAHFANDTMTNL